MKRIMIIICIFSLILCGTFSVYAAESDAEEGLDKVAAEAKEKTASSDDASKEEQSSDDGSTKVKKRKSKNESEGRMLLTAGGGLSINIPGVEIVHDGYINWNEGDTKTNVFVAFGFNVLGNVTFTYRLENQWAIGGSVNLGYNLMGGPHAQYEVRYKNEKYTNTYRGFGKLYHSFLADFNFMARSPMKKGGDLILEAGLRLLPTWSFLVYRQNGTTLIGETAYSDKGYTNAYTGEINYFSYKGSEATMMAGPDFFVGIDYFINDYFDIIGGLRLGAVFGCGDTKYIDAGITKQSYLNSVITIALEAKFNWYKKF